MKVHKNIHLIHNKEFMARLLNKQGRQDMYARKEKNDFVGKSRMYACCFLAGCLIWSVIIWGIIS